MRYYKRNSKLAADILHTAVNFNISQLQERGDDVRGYRVGFDGILSDTLQQVSFESRLVGIMRALKALPPSTNSGVWNMSKESLSKIKAYMGEREFLKYLQPYVDNGWSVDELQLMVRAVSQELNLLDLNQNEDWQKRLLTKKGEKAYDLLIKGKQPNEGVGGIFKKSVKLQVNFKKLRVDIEEQFYKDHLKSNRSAWGILEETVSEVAETLKGSRTSCVVWTDSRSKAALSLELQARQGNYKGCAIYKKRTIALPYGYVDVYILVNGNTLMNEGEQEDVRKHHEDICKKGKIVFKGLDKDNVKKFLTEAKSRGIPRCISLVALSAVKNTLIKDVQIPDKYAEGFGDLLENSSSKGCVLSGWFNLDSPSMSKTNDWVSQDHILVKTGVPIMMMIIKLMSKHKILDAQLQNSI